MSNFVEFRDNRNFTFFEVRRGVRDTWHFMSGSRGATCPGQSRSTMSSSVGHGWILGIMPLDENLKVVG